MPAPNRKTITLRNRQLKERTQVEQMGTVRLYHGSDVAIRKPDLKHNTGFADLGKGFYLTDNYEVAASRARARARRQGSAQGVVSTYDFDEGSIPWVILGSAENQPTQPLQAKFGLRFAPTAEGLAAWVRYIGQCRKGKTEVPDIGAPAVVRAWIATEEVEMAFAGYVLPEDVAAAIDPADLVVQYCLLDQKLIEGSLAYI